MPSSLHQIRRGEGHTVNGRLPSTPSPIGTPLGFSIIAADGDNTFGLANGAVNSSTGFGSKVFIKARGFQTRDSRSFPGNSDTELAFGFGVETPFLAGAEGSVEHGTDLDVEGTSYVLSAATVSYPDATLVSADANASGYLLSSSTPAGTELCFRNGLFAAAAVGDYVEFTLDAVKTASVAGNLRIFATATRGYSKTSNAI